MNRAWWMLSMVALMLAAAVAGAQQQGGNAPEDAMKLARERAAEYTEAFNRGDAQAVAELHTEDAIRAVAGVLRNEGREEIESYFRTAFADNPEAKIEITVEHACLLRPDVLLIEGPWTVTGLSPGTGPSAGGSTVVAMKEEGAWRLAYVVIYPPSENWMPR